MQLKRLVLSVLCVTVLAGSLANVQATKKDLVRLLTQIKKSKLYPKAGTDKNDPIYFLEYNQLDKFEENKDLEKANKESLDIIYQAGFSPEDIINFATDLFTQSNQMKFDLVMLFGGSLLTAVTILFIKHHIKEKKAKREKSEI